VSELASGKQYDHAQVTDQMIGGQLPAARRRAAGGMIAYRIKRRRKAA